MAFAQEMKDFLSAFSTIRQIRDQSSSTKSNNSYRDALRKKMEWEMGAEDRERQRMIDFAANRRGGGFYDRDVMGGAEGSGGGTPVASNSGFEAKVAAYAPRLAKDTGISVQAAAGILGQLGHESEGLNPTINERNPIVKGSRGGVGWAQWTGPRRRQFEQFVGDGPMDDEANYNFLLAELKGPEGRVLEEIRRVNDPLRAGRIFTDRFLRPGIPGYASRDKWASRAANVVSRHLSGGGGSNSLAGGAMDDTLPPNEAGEDEVIFTPEDAAAIPVLEEDTPEFNAADEATLVDPASPLAGMEDTLRDVKHTFEAADAERKRKAVSDAQKIVRHLDGEPVEAEGDAELTPEVTSEPTAIPEPGQQRQMGYDPLPQTGGGFDAVSRTGNQTLAPGAQVLAQRNFGKTPMRTILGESLKQGMSILGLSPEGIDTQSDSPQAQAFMDGRGAINMGQVIELEQAIDPNGEMTDDQRKLEAMSTMWEYYMARGEPEKARTMVFGLYQTYKAVSQQYAAMAQGAAEDGDWESAADALIKAYSVVPDGLTLDAVTNEDGSMTIQTINEETGRVINQTKLAKEDVPKYVMERAMNVSPGDFDLFVMRSITGERPDSADPDKIADQQTLREMYTSDAGVPEGSVPSDAEEMPMPDIGGTGVVTADTADTGTAIPEPGEAPARPSAYPVDGEAPPAPEPYHVFRQQLGRLNTPQARTEAKADWAQRQQEYNNWLKTQVSPEEQEALDAVSNFWTELATTPEDQPFNPDERIYGMAGSSELISQMRNAVSEHNSRAEGVRGEEGNRLLTEATNDFFDPDLGEEIPAGMDEQYMGEFGRTQVPMPQRRELPKWDAERYAALPPEQQRLYREQFEAAKAEAEEYNKQFAPRSPITPGETSTLAVEEITSTVIPAVFESLRTSEADPQHKAIYDAVENDLKRVAATPVVAATARELMYTDGNSGMTPEIATEAVLFMLSIPDPNNPPQRIYDARPVEGRPDLVYVSPKYDNAPGLYMPRASFEQVDAKRAEIVKLHMRDFAKRNEAAREAAERKAASEATNPPIEDYGVREIPSLGVSSPFPGGFNPLDQR